MSSYKKNRNLNISKRNDISFLKSTALLATLIIVNYLLCTTVIL